MLIDALYFYGYCIRSRLDDVVVPQLSGDSFVLVSVGCLLVLALCLTSKLCLLS